jgi:hypothetical protein
MMRITVLLTSALLTTASGSCVLDSSGTVSNAIDSALYIWTATKRCAGPVVGDAPIKCEQDVASSVKAVTATAGAIAGMMNSCGAIDDTNAKCGLAVNGLISATAGLAAAGGKITQFCKDKDFGEEPELKTVLGKCTIQSGGAINSIFDAKNTIGHLQKGCDANTDGKKCAVNVLDVVSVVADLGAHLAGSAAFCQQYATNGAAKVGAEMCTNGVLEAIAQLSNVARIAMGVEKACSKASTRLYLEGNGEAATSGPSATMMAALLAALPITAVLGVIAGMRMAKSRQQAAFE